MTIHSGGTHRTHKPSAAPKASKGKSDAGSSKKAQAARPSGTKDRVLLTPCRQAIRTKIKGGLKRRRYYAPLRITAKVIKHLLAPQLGGVIPTDLFVPNLDSLKPSALAAPGAAAHRAPAFLPMGL